MDLDWLLCCHVADSRHEPFFFSLFSSVATRPGVSVRSSQEFTRRHTKYEVPRNEPTSCARLQSTCRFNCPQVALSGVIGMAQLAGTKNYFTCRYVTPTG